MQYKVKHLVMSQPLFIETKNYGLKLESSKNTDINIYFDPDLHGVPSFVVLRNTGHFRVVTISGVSDFALYDSSFLTDEYKDLWPKLVVAKQQDVRPPTTQAQVSTPQSVGQQPVFPMAKPEQPKSGIQPHFEGER